MEKGLLGLVKYQYIIFAILNFLGFLSWIVALLFEFNYVGELGYITDHLEFWTTKEPYWGFGLLISSILSILTVRNLIKDVDRAFSWGILAFSFAFVINMMIAKTWLVHLVIGVLIGWIVLIPLFFYVYTIKSIK